MEQIKGDANKLKLTRSFLIPLFDKLKLTRSFYSALRSIRDAKFLFHLIPRNHAGDFGFEEKIITANVASDDEPGPARLRRQFPEAFFDFGGLAISDGLHNLLRRTLQVAEHGAEALKGHANLTGSVAEAAGGAGGIDGGGAGDEDSAAGGSADRGGAGEG